MGTPLSHEFSRAAEQGSNPGFGLCVLAMLAGVWQAERMKKQASDQSFHDRRYQERKRAEAARKPAKKKVEGRSRAGNREARETIAYRSKALG